MISVQTPQNQLKYPTGHRFIGKLTATSASVLLDRFDRTQRSCLTEPPLSWLYAVSLLTIYPKKAFQDLQFGSHSEGKASSESKESSEDDLSNAGEVLTAHGFP